MATAANTVRSFYSALSAGDVERATSLMTDDVEWITVQAWPEPDTDGLELLSAFIGQTLAERFGTG